MYFNVIFVCFKWANSNCVFVAVKTIYIDTVWVKINSAFLTLRKFCNNHDFFYLTYIYIVSFFYVFQVFQALNTQPNLQQLCVYYHKFVYISKSLFRFMTEKKTNYTQHCWCMLWINRIRRRQCMFIVYVWFSIEKQ